MALSRGVVLFFLLLLVVAEIGTIEAKKRSKLAKKTAKSLMKDKKEKEKEEEEEEEKEKEKEGSNHCLSQSHQFKGYCFSSETCAAVCMKESFHSGECKFENALRKCFCKKPC